MIPDPVRHAVRTRLDLARREHGARVLFAIESGSRAWGFPSPDSDWDCRFVYVRPLAAYLALEPPRDVIEQPIVDDLDVGGWDLRKALQLLRKSNAVVVEWLASPLVYEERPGVRAALLALAQRALSPRAYAHHYLSLGERALNDHVGGGRAEIRLKKVFYALRPAAALDHLMRHPDRPPPMALPAILQGLALSPALSAEIAALIARKAETREMGVGAVPPAVMAYIAESFARARAALPDLPAAPADPALEPALDAFFRDTVLAAD